MNKERDSFLNGAYEQLGKSDGNVFIYDQNGPRLFMSLPFSSAEHIANISSSNIELGLFEHGPVLFFLFRFGDDFWADAPFNINQNAADSQCLPETDAPLRIRYFDSTKEKIVAEREVQLPEAFSASLRAAVTSQQQTLTSIGEFMEVMRDAYSEYSEPWQMVAWTSASCEVSCELTSD